MKDSNTLSSWSHLALVLGLTLVMAPATGVWAQEAGLDPTPGQPLEGGSTIIDLDHPVTASGTLDLWRAMSSQGARVMLKVYRPEGDRLVLVGTSALETVAAGEVATFACGIPVARNDIIGVFCPDTSCVDSLPEGTILSAVGDLGTSPRSEFVIGAGAPSVFSSSSLLAGVPSFAGSELVVPVVARTPGLNGTVWSTSLELYNPTETAAEVALFFNRSGLDNTTPAAAAAAVIEPRATLRYDDLLVEAFDLTDDVGSVDVLATEAVFCHGRIANDGGENGSFGQTVPAVPAQWALAEDTVPGANPDADTAVLFECHENAESRCNIGVASVANVPLTVIVTARIGVEAVGTPLTIQLEAFSHTQINRILQVMGVASLGGVRLEVDVAPGSSGRFFAYLSRVDNTSGDAVFLSGDRVSTLP